MRFKDCNGDSVISVTKSDRAKILSHLGNASASVSDQRHPVHGHLKKAASELGAVVDTSATEGIASDSPGEIDRNVPARAQGASQATGASAISTKALRDLTVQNLYKASAQEKNPKRKATLETAAYELDRLPDSELEKVFAPVKVGSFTTAGRPLRSYLERHAG